MESASAKVPDVSKSTAVARVLTGDRLECHVVSPGDKTLRLAGTTADLEPVIEGSHAELNENRALVHNAWAFAKFTHLKVSLPTAEEQKFAEKRAKAHRRVALWIADVADDLTSEGEHGWCSGCFGQHFHRKANRPRGQLPAFVCNNCGTPTLTCPGPGCSNMAVRLPRAIRAPRYCAEHRHEISGFAKADRKMGSLDDYEAFLRYEKLNLARATKTAGIGAVGLTGVGALTYLAAPAIGGAVGTLVGGYSGAAATSYGLALLGGGAVAAGGLGVIGGTAVITALGGALGGALGASIANAYLREDGSFEIEKLCDGDEVPVVVCNGFLSEGRRGWGEWRDIITDRYPNSPVYRVHWGAKELKHLPLLAGRSTAKVIGGAALKTVAAKATKAGANAISPLLPALVVADLAKNPWHVAKNRAEKTGIIVADLIARTDTNSYVLVGHSLGARAMVVAAQNLESKPDGPRVHVVHLLGAAIGAKSDWHTLIHGVDDVVNNYHSTNDDVLRKYYRVAQAGQKAAGLTGFTPSSPKLNNIDVSALVTNHFTYHTRVELR